MPVCFDYRYARLKGSCPARAAARGGRAPAPPARDFVPWIPDLMHRRAKCLTRRPTGNIELAVVDNIFSISKACAGTSILS